MDNLLRSLRQNLLASQRQFNRIVNRDDIKGDASKTVHITTGMRHTGKTTSMMQTIATLMNDGVHAEQILHINLEDERLLPINAQSLVNLLDHFYTLLEQGEHAGKKTYLFLDQIQHVKDWPDTLQQVCEKRGSEVFLTANSQSLSGQNNDWLQGNSVIHEAWPFDFNEFLQARRVKVDPNLPEAERMQKARKWFMTYLQRSGFPDLIGYAEAEQRRSLLRYVDAVMLRDLVEAHKISNTPVLRQLIRHVLQGVGQPFSINKFFNHIKAQGYSINRDRLYDYLAYMEDAYLCFTVPLHATSTRKVRVNGKIIYTADPGLANAYQADGVADLGALFRNVVFLDLKRRGCEVCYYLTEGRDMIDFFVTNPDGEQHLIQTIWDTHRPRTMAKQMRALGTASEELKIPGRVLTLDRYLREGIGQ